MFRAFVTMIVFIAGLQGAVSGDARLETILFGEASEAHPRHSEGSIIELKDGSLLIAWQEYLPGNTGDSDFSPNCIATMRSSDGGRTWRDRQVLVETPEGDTNSY